MLPFLKERKEGSASGPVETVKREPDEGAYEMLDAITADMIDAIHSRDKKLLKGTLEALIEHIKEEDAVQDLEELE